MSTYGSSMFMDIGATPRTPWQSFALSYVVQGIALVALLFYTIVAPRIAPPATTHVELVAPDLTPVPRVAPRPAARQMAKVEAPKIAVHVVETPALHAPQPQRLPRYTPPVEMAQPQIAAAPKFDSKVLTTLPGPKATARIVATNTFGGSSAPQTLQNIAPSKVQTGGFGDPNGIPANAHGSARSVVAAAGSFDLPGGSGYGNGSGGSKGVRGTVASAGFGNGVAVQGGGGHSGNAAQGRVQATGFAVAPPALPEKRTNAGAHQQLSAPVSIQSKPTPLYTSEARQLKVEGEVLLNVVFTADGRIRILNVVHGLGHGLDESAQHAAQGVKFSPAMRDGHPVDSNAILHIVFQLS